MKILGDKMKQNKIMWKLNMTSIFYLISGNTMI